ncbi:MAG TPA: phenylalanine--tRNA ligase subunit beta, partial [Chthoniobacteraceae bacterium]|nr:phenylalanine--tRNA ligase subunit beta [Chthoniobacteraceae bacterium]
VEVEHVETSGAAIDNVVVAQILESVQHPNADRLSVCKVDDGSGTPRQIVCGAKNYKVGDKVPLALPGAVLPGDFKIKVGKLRGVESAGMLCSGKELGIADDADGLLILPQEARIGAPIAELYPADTVLELEITPNRPDLLSYIGIAREVAALTRGNFKSPIDDLKLEGLSHAAQLKVTAVDECPLYTARRIDGVKVGASPDWLKRKLEASGIRSINNIVDITNFVMLETGQPLHAFDADKLEGAIQVRMANQGEEFLALDGRTYKLTADNLVIADQQRAVAIAGVMGGEETGVTESTANVVLESALFLASNIRRTARNLGLMSDSSYRFERGVDAAGVLVASARATQLISEIAGGNAANWMLGMGEGSAFGFDPARAAETEKKVEITYTRSVSLRHSRARQLLGADISESRIDEILAAFQLKKEGDTWRIPSFRQDLTREIDLIEEITRVYGIENIPARETSRYAESTATDRAHDRNMLLRRALAAQGFYEARTLSLVNESAAQSVPEVRRVRNPLNSDQVVLRPNLLGGLLGVVANNARGGNKTLRLFELGRVFHADANEERTHLAFVMTGAVAEKSWRGDADRSADIFDAKGVLASLGLGDLSFEPAEDPLLALAAAVKLGGAQIGMAGQLWPAKARELDIATPIVAVEIELPAAPRIAAKTYAEIPKYPAVTRDIALVAPEAVRHAQVEDVLQALKEPLLERVELFDVFTDPEGKKVPAGQKSMAYSLTYRDKNRTLTVDEVNAAHARLKDRLKADLGVTFRE